MAARKAVRPANVWPVQALRRRLKWFRLAVSVRCRNAERMCKGEASMATETESSFKFVKATIAGGLLFLLPLVLVVLLLTHAMRFAGKVAHPISEFLSIDRMLGPAGEESVALVMLLLISVAAGLIARTAAG